jgi:ElaA protein
LPPSVRSNPRSLDVAATQWRCLPFAQVPAAMLYRALGLRSQVFVVEQQCLYQDLDGSDLDALLVIGSLPPPETGGDAAEVIATARVLPPGARFAEPSIGRVCTAAAYRGEGLGRMLMKQAIRAARGHYPGLAIRISAQAYLQAFYESLGFAAVSAGYLEDGIPHLEMRLPPG